MMKIENLITQQAAQLSPQTPAITNSKSEGGFNQILSDAIQSIEGKQFGADDKLQALASGEDVDIHGTMLAMKEAEITLKLAVSLRDKFLEAYQKILQMPM